ncbi:protein adenylyltransferase SelO family protein [Phycisphaera mikurensis]|uniref:Protein nucleotidyltransferase YdiU n=1 Tax=Phycisphaera mikurensis (strain NBRC 102666 / KCTC 22515 / FYK2301M01) TaxID=1142394 RepID=I0IJ87_PHYMF|nr:protein adenylyltransferase SelO family protein [Phycisphaera mikurensis]MBB6441875.1 uncharacterized protein YdiU (UPF0061 family) [Phycisphaera mikurensis]BAM05325.1 hypothetical protein PSMK_31660 [Phycisphaera mikurensis NBRC 102666]
MSWTSPYDALPDAMRTAWAPEGPADGHTPRLVFWNAPLAAELGLEADAAVWSGGRVPEDAAPAALAYAGHQFGSLAMLGDGRAVLLGGRRLAGREADVQLKGSGPTPYGRGGDGRAALGPMLREALFSESMHALGVPTTRTLAVATTGREASRPGLPPAWTGGGAVLTRVAASHLRVGTFVLAAHHGPAVLGGVLRLAAARHDPDLLAGDASEPELADAFLRRVIARQAALVAGWMSLGFVHGVLNTDNVAVSGETIDYGPCAFVGRFSPEAVFSSIDRRGRYAYGNQPGITAWNLARLAEALLPLLGDDEGAQIAAAEDALACFGPAYGAALDRAAAAKLGGVADAATLYAELLALMAEERLDFTGTFRHLSGDAAAPAPAGGGFAAWAARWRDRFGSPEAVAGAQARMRRVNPATVPRSAHAEAALGAANAGDEAPFLGLLGACQKPFERDAAWSAVPAVDLPVPPTFCGT